MLISNDFPPACEHIQALRDCYRSNENQVLDPLLVQARLPEKGERRARTMARTLVQGIRQAQNGRGGVDALLHEFSLSTEEGIVLMCLAEALLRVPDSETCEALIRDKLTQGDWSSHLGNSDSLFVNASAWGLLLAGSVVGYESKQAREEKVSLLKRAVHRLGEPVIRASMRYAMKIMGAQFVMGTHIDAALKRAIGQENKGYCYSYDMLGEGARTQAAADRYFESYQRAIEAIGKAAAGRGPERSPGISVKLSALHPRYELSQRQRVLSEMVPRLKQLALLAKHYDIGFTVDAEEADRLELSLEVIATVFRDSDLDGWSGFGLAIQAYQKRAIKVVEWTVNLAQTVGRRIMVRLVKGAYWDSEIKWTQEQGLADYPVFTRKPSTDVSYQACARLLLESREWVFPQFATHNAYTVATILEMDSSDAYPSRQGYEFQRLHGMGETLFDQVMTLQRVSCRIYAPVGEHSDLLAYLVRRLLENGANSSFVNNIVDEKIPVDSLLQDPVATVASWADKRHPAIPLPENLYAASPLESGQRSNSKGIEMTDVATLTALKNAMESWWSVYSARQLSNPGDGPAHSAEYQETASDSESLDWVAVKNPANLSHSVGHLQFADRKSIESAIALAHGAYSDWANTDVTWRSALLRRLASTLENHAHELMCLCTVEAGKTLADGVAEVREAVDFCRYYADRAEELMRDNRYSGRGVVLCVSPWNFPVAIFLGQVVAALVTGNTVVAKPAEQTSLVAKRVLELMLDSGFPKEVVQLTIAEGKPLGEQLVPDPRVRAVMFTGSTETAGWISRTLAERDDGDIPLIAETGGQNAMIVDSTALPEQVVDDVIQSGFQSAGQRCSALRVLFLQDDIADNMISMIKGAMDELSIGDPAHLTTDVGPVIDLKAYQRLLEHTQELSARTSDAKLLHACVLPQECLGGNFFVPHLFEIDDLSVLKREVFGPVVHVIRFKAGTLDQVVEQINATGYGLTLGIHSRIEGVCQRVVATAKVGNVYINRNMIGAIVGVQPFGGCGLSGTGPKAGGPHYLKRLIQPCSSVATTRIVGESDFFTATDAARVDSPFAVKIHSALQHTCAEISYSRDFENGFYELLSLLQQSPVSSVVLPGPTGEQNRLEVEPRGRLAVICGEQDDPQIALLQLLMAMVTGNTVVWVGEPRKLDYYEPYFVSLGQRPVVTSLLELETELKSSELEGVMMQPQSTFVSKVKRVLSLRSGALIPLILDSCPTLVLPRLELEKTISIDTTAAGGNASLMTMDEEQVDSPERIHAR